jgi:signal transduction histidine kinase
VETTQLQGSLLCVYRATVSNSASQLEASLRRAITKWSKKEGIPVAIHCNGLVGTEVPAVIKDAALVFLAEGLKNVATHSDAARASVFIRCSGGRLRVLVEDDGVGFAGGSRRRGSGLQKLLELAARVGGVRLLESRRGHGTSLGFEVQL